MITAVSTMTAMHAELRDLQAARRAELGALREMLAACGADGDRANDEAAADRMRDSVAAILRLQKIMARLDE